MTQEAALLDWSNGPKPQKNCCPPCWYTCHRNENSGHNFCRNYFPTNVTAGVQRMIKGSPDNPGSLPCSAQDDMLLPCSCGYVLKALEMRMISKLSPTAVHQKATRQRCLFRWTLLRCKCEIPSHLSVLVSESYLAVRRYSVSRSAVTL